MISSQEEHDRFGGVVPEIASRHHLELIDAVVERPCAGRQRPGGGRAGGGDPGPGLIGALLVGLSSAKAIAAARELPFAAVDHLQGHVAANFLRAGRRRRAFEPPFVCLIASGGHTLLARVASTTASRCSAARSTTPPARPSTRAPGCSVSATRAAPRWSGWPRGGDPEAFSFPGSPASAPARDARRAGGLRARASTSPSPGVKTALLYRLRELSEQERERGPRDLAASYQAAIVESLLARTERALSAERHERLAVGGGVAANGELRRRLRRARRRSCTSRSARCAPTTPR